LPFWPPTKSIKGRIKEHERKWHHDIFETRILPKVVDADKQKVKEGEGTVMKHLIVFAHGE